MIGAPGNDASSKSHFRDFPRRRNSEQVLLTIGNAEVEELIANFLIGRSPLPGYKRLFGIENFRNWITSAQMSSQKPPLDPQAAPSGVGPPVLTWLRGWTIPGCKWGIPCHPKDQNVVLRVEDGDLRGHALVFDEKDVHTAHQPTPETRSEARPVVADAKTFRDVFDAFEPVISTYRNFLALTMSIAPKLSTVIAQRTIKDFAKAKGKQRHDLTTDNRVVYEMGMSTYRQFVTHHGEIEAALEGAKLLPEVMLIGLVSAYDSFLGKLLRVVITLQENII